MLAGELSSCHFVVRQRFNCLVTFSLMHQHVFIINTATVYSQSLSRYCFCKYCFVLNYSAYICVYFALFLRVHPYHARAFVKRLLDLSAPDNEDDGSELHKSSVSDACVGRGGVFYYENMEGGHGGAADNKQHAYMTVLHIEFLKRTIGKGVM